ncbi:hypothetical protein TW65_02005 [Stemphylium lycopersici]|nr:hypothetical protein TW65_02005 [Stemphylium lycopersici]
MHVLPLFALGFSVCHGAALVLAQQEVAVTYTSTLIIPIITHVVCTQKPPSLSPSTTQPTTTTTLSATAMGTQSSSPSLPAPTSTQAPNKCSEQVAPSVHSSRSPTASAFTTTALTAPASIPTSQVHVSNPLYAPWVTPATASLLCYDFLIVAAFEEEDEEEEKKKKKKKKKKKRERRELEAGKEGVGG